MYLPKMTRAEMECEVLEHEILPCNTSAELSAIGALSDDELREKIGTWIEAGSEV